MIQLTRDRCSCCRDFRVKWSGRLDSNQRPPAPKAGALTRLRYAPTRQEYYENDARRHEALRRRTFVALCVAPCGEGRRIWRALAMIAAVEASPSSSKSSGRAARAGDLVVLDPTLDPRVRVVLEVVRSGAIETEMSEWLKEHAWKSDLFTRADAHQIPPTHSRSTTSRNIDTRLRVLVNHRVDPGFRGVCDTVLTQNRIDVTDDDS